MPVQIALAVLGGDAIERIAHVLAHLLVPILIHAQRAARVLHKQVQQPDLVGRDLGEGGHDLAGDEVGAPRARGQGERSLEPGGHLFFFFFSLGGGGVVGGGKAVGWAGWR